MGSNLQPQQILGSFQRLLQIYGVSGSTYVLDGTGSFVDLHLSGSITAISGTFQNLTVNGNQIFSGSTTIVSGGLTIDDLEDREIVFVTGSTLSGSGAFKWNYDTSKLSITGSIDVSGSVEWHKSTVSHSLEQIISVDGSGNIILLWSSDGTGYNQDYFYLYEHLTQGGLFAAWPRYQFFTSGSGGHISTFEINSSNNTSLVSIYDPIKGNEAFRGHVSYSAIGWQQDIAVYDITSTNTSTWNLGPKGGNSIMGSIIVSNDGVIRSSSIGGNSIISTDSGIIDYDVAYTSILSGRSITATQHSSSYLNQLVFQNTTDTNDATVKVATLSGDVTHTLQDRTGTLAHIDDPNAQMTGSFSGSFTGDGSGLTGVGGSPGGADTQIQFNDGGSFGGDSDFTWNKTNNILTINGGTVSASIFSASTYYGDGSNLTGIGGGSPGGSNTQIQFNDASSFGGDSDFTWDKTNNILVINGGTVSASIFSASTYYGDGSNLTGIASDSASYVEDYNVNPNMVTLSVASNVLLWDVSASLSATVTLDQNITTFTLNSAKAGQSGTIIMKQDGTGGYTTVLPGSSVVVNNGGGVVSLTGTANSIDILSWFYDGSSFYWNAGYWYT